MYKDDDIKNIILQQVGVSAEQFNAYLFEDYIGYITIKNGYFAVLDDCYDDIYTCIINEPLDRELKDKYLKEGKEYLLLNDIIKYDY
jgi:hypothetical protein